ncbi:MAG TPA: hypothetical protein VJS92_17535 [Candidatus Polarisedimenticolaceae bacterium]|nr:hypothetical protein [Candidatus Polarisedimenticolaceae bacterium]
MRWIAPTMLILAVAPVFAQAPPPQSDEALIDSLRRATPEAIDLRRVAKLFYGVAATLDSGKGSVRQLRGRARVPEGALDSALGLIDAQYEAYSRGVDQFKDSVSRLLDEPDSRALLLRALLSGQRACWQLDQESRLLEAYGLAAGEQRSIQTSSEACGRFRTAAFGPRLEGVLFEALSEARRSELQVLSLQEDVRDLQQLVDDLRRIDGKP